MDKLRKFETKSGYTSAVPTLIHPTVSHIVEDGSVKYMSVFDKYKKMYLTFEAIDDVTFTLTKSASSSYYLTQEQFTDISYSTDDGETWTTLTNDGSTSSQALTTPTITAGSKVIWKGSALQLSMNRLEASCRFSASGKYKVYGNIMSLLYGDDFIGKTSFPTNSQYAFTNLFMPDEGVGQGYLQSIENLILPATTLVENCYTTMFIDNTAIKRTPLLIAATPAQNCYNGMFMRCGSLNYVNTLMTADFTTPMPGMYTSMWLGNVARTGTFIKHPDAVFRIGATDGIPEGWTVKPPRL